MIRFAETEHLLSEKEFQGSTHWKTDDVVKTRTIQTLEAILLC